MISEVDYIIVGAGSSGCVLASELSKDERVSVGVLESGPPDDSFLIHMPRGLAKLLTVGDPHCWHYEVSPGGNRSPETWLKGRTLGGSSSINGMTYVRGVPEDYDGWESLGCEGWGWHDMLPCFTALEDHELGASAQRGVGGPLHITVQPPASLTDAILAAAEEAGLPRVLDVNSGADCRIGYSQQTISRGSRQSAAVAFLYPAMQRTNLHVLTDTTVLRILFDNGRAAAVEYRDKSGTRKKLRANKEVILCAGALESPKLLQLSGIGPASLLKSLDIEVVADSPDVGQNLQEHMVVQTQFLVSHGSANQQFRGWRLALNTARYFFNKTGVLSYGPCDFNGFLKSQPTLSRPDCQMFGGLFSLIRTDKGVDVDKRPGMTLSGYVMRPKSRGKLAIRSSDPDTPPVIFANYLANEDDRIASIALLRYFRRIAAQPALSQHVIAEDSPGKDINTDDELLNIILDQGVTAFHVSGTCRMGADERSVVDPQLRVRGVTGLRVVDTSIFPNMVSGNTNAPAMAVGFRAAMIIRNASLP